MASLKDVKMKISGVRKTRQITRAMNMVASAKLRGAQARIERFRPYAEKYRSVMAGLASSADGESHPLLAEHAEKKHCCIIMATSDRGLCGGFNAGIINASLELAAGRSRAGLEPSFICVGRKGRDAIRKTPYPILRAYGDRMGSIDYALAGEVADEAIAAYERQELDEVWLVYGRFVSMAQQPPTESSLLPMQTPEMEGAQSAGGTDGGAGSEYIYEPDEARLLDSLLPRYIRVQVFSALLETAASEHAARMAAMDNATRNCDEMINTLTLLYNKTRQATITSELIDIVGGAEALKG